MAGKWCDEGELDVLEIYLKNEPQHEYGLYLGIYTDPTTEPGEDATLLDLTEPSGDDGYARIALDPADWTITGTDPTVASNLKKTFMAVGGDWGVAYGYFITDVETGYEGKLIAVEQFSDGPYEILDGAKIDVTPKINCL